MTGDRPISAHFYATEFECNRNDWSLRLLHHPGTKYFPAKIFDGQNFSTLTLSWKLHERKNYNFVINDLAEKHAYLRIRMHSEK